MPKKSNKKRADGRYSVQVYLGMVNGKRKYKTVYGATQKEANEKADELKLKLGKGIDIGNKDTFEDWSNHYLEIKQNEVSESRYNLIDARLQYWIDCFGKQKISTIKPIDIQPFLNALGRSNPHTSKPSSKATLTNYLQILKSVFDYAIDNRVIEFNPASKLKLPPNSKKRERRSLTQIERARIVEFEHRGKTAMMLLMFSGLRRGEATALLWKDIDFKNHTISVTKSFDYKSKTTKAPKNGKSRTVTVPNILIDYLKTVKQNSFHVLTTTQGNPMSEMAWKRLLESYLYDMNLKYGTFTKKYKKYSPEKVPMSIAPFTLHCLRHTFCTIMYEAGIDVLVAQQQMGHSDPKTTLAIYTHLENNHKKQNISKLDEYIKKTV